jgi:PAS domain S-box-containing protein
VRMLGARSAEEVVGKNLPRLVMPGQVESAADSLSTWLAQATDAARIETWFVRPDGTWLPVEAIIGRFNWEGEPAAQIIVRDITERRRAEEALAQEQYLLSTLMASTPDHIYFKDAESRFLRINPAMADSFGLTDPHQAVGKTDDDFFSQEHARQAQADEQQVMLSRQPLIGKEEKETWPDGRETWVSTTKVPLRDQAGRIIGTFGISRDITQRKMVHQALEESKRQLESREQFISRIIESIPSSLVVIDRGLRIVSVNRNFLDKARRDNQATLGRKIEEVFPTVLLEYTQLGKKVQDVFRTGQPVEGGKASYRAPGLATRIYFYRLIPLKLGDEVEHVMLLLDDVTEREQLGKEVRRAERHLASVVECANDLVASTDPAGRIMTWNRAAESASGRKAEEVRGHPLVSLCSTEHQATMMRMLTAVARGGKVRSTEADLVTAEGDKVPIAWSCSRMQDDNGVTTGVVAVGRDLTERRRLEAQITQSAKMASLGVMARGIAHELRNPLGIISSTAQLLAEHQDDAALCTECVQKIHTATQRASLIIENLLKFARPQEEHMKQVDLNGVLEQTLALLAPQMTLQRVRWRADLQAALPDVHGNAGLLQQVFTNLILNACNAMPQGGDLVIRTRAVEVKRPAGQSEADRRSTGICRQVEIQVSDTGHGIKPEHLPKIFDPFFTTMPVGKGVGLGLSISYAIIQQHQGTVDVQSQPGHGTTFTLRLPCQVDGGPDAPR